MSMKHIVVLVCVLLVSALAVAQPTEQRQEMSIAIPDQVPDIALSFIPQQRVNAHLSASEGGKTQTQTMSVVFPDDGNITVSPGAVDNPTLDVSITQEAVMTIQEMEVGPGDDAFYEEIYRLLEEGEISYEAHTVFTKAAMDLMETMLAVQVGDTQQSGN